MKINMNLEDIAGKAVINKSKNDKMYSYLKMQDDDKIDKIVHRIYDQVVSQINCLECANCCKKLGTSVSEEDIEKMAKYKQITKEEFTALYIEEDYLIGTSLKDLPCIFLNGNKCKIYNDKPEPCSHYPHLHKKDFTHRLHSVFANYAVCPIVFNTVEELKKALNFR
ncbi:MAG: uncharacterized protein QG635_2389 [Bacteroidota bacterium]|nr:uncharacterized protein [Bacteroidota bacterium]